MNSKISVFSFILLKTKFIVDKTREAWDDSSLASFSYAS